MVGGDDLFAHSSCVAEQQHVMTGAPTLMSVTVGTVHGMYSQTYPLHSVHFPTEERAHDSAKYYQPPWPMLTSAVRWLRPNLLAN